MLDNSVAVRPAAVRPVPGAAGNDRQLAEATERLLRAPRGKLAMALHLSRVGSPGGHQTRVAMALMQDTAQRFGGQVFALRNGDLAMLCGAQGAGGGTPLRLLDALGRLFSGAGPEDLCSVWRLEDSGAAFLDWAKDGGGIAPPARSFDAQPEGQPSSPAARLAELAGQMAQTDLRRLIAVETALQPGTMRPVFRALTQHPEDVDGADRALLTDPIAAAFLAGRLSVRLLEALPDLVAGAPWLLRDLPLHLSLTLDAIVHPAFAACAERLRGAGRIEVAVPASDIVHDPAVAALARGMIDLAGFGLSLRGLDAVSLPALRPAAFRPSSIRVRWSSDLQGKEAVFGRLGPGSLILENVDGPEAIAFAVHCGLSAMQGPALDAARAQDRMANCPTALACSAAQCTTRGKALSPAIRQGCGYPALLAAVS